MSNSTRTVTIAQTKNAAGQTVNNVCLSDDELTTIFKDVGKSWEKPTPLPLPSPGKPFRFSMKFLSGLKN